MPLQIIWLERVVFVFACRYVFLMGMLMAQYSFVGYEM